jgi:hypothetical protein
MKRHKARFMECRLADMEVWRLQIQCALIDVEADRLASPQPGARQQTEQGG